GEGLDPGVAGVVRAAIEELRGLGAEIREVHLPHSDYGLPVYYIIAPAEASANLARYDGVRYGLRVKNAPDIWSLLEQTREQGFGAEVKRRIMLGTYALSTGYYDAYYKKAQQVRTLIRGDFDRAFQEVDVVAGPVSPTVAFRIGERADNPLQMYLADIYTISLNLAGLPGMSVPCGFVDGLPVGLQLIAPAFAEETLLRVSHAYEQATQWHTRRPQIVEPVKRNA
ncbi:MAG TPA: amidase family protein, partial [Ardenticatenaceae bacterium]|nr:amidase family protein [Ardenticatenaceae bacterium]